MLTIRCHAVSVADNTAYAYSKINEDLQAGGLDVQAEEIIDIIDGYQGRGYGLSTQHELGGYLNFSKSCSKLMFKCTPTSNTHP